MSEPAVGCDAVPGVNKNAVLCAERAKRVDDAINLRQPDRVPIFLPFGNLLRQLEGVTNAELYSDPEKAFRATVNAAQRFQPDIFEGLFSTPEISRVVGDRMTKWPGYGLDDNGSYQYHEADYMKAEDYDAFLADPGDWTVRRYLPRVLGELGGLAMLPPLGVFGYGAIGMMQLGSIFAVPPVAHALRALLKLGEVHQQWVQHQISSVQRMAALGFPPCVFFVGALVSAPFDFMSDTLRGMRGIFTDMRRCPEKLLAAEEKVMPMMLETAKAVCAARHIPYALIPLHRGSDGFMSVSNFEKFYWPQLKRVILSLIEMGITPVVLWEGSWDQRLQYLAELPRAKTVGVFQNTDLAKAKEVVGDVMCIVGGMPNSMLVGGTPSEIREHTHKMCETVGKGGGFIYSSAIGDLEGCNPDLIHAWVDATLEYGNY